MQYFLCNVPAFFMVPWAGAIRIKEVKHGQHIEQTWAES